MKILFIDDNKDLRKIFEKIGEEWGFSGMTASSLKEGLNLAKGYLPDLIVLDLELKEREIFYFLSELRSGPETLDTQIVGCAVRNPEKWKNGIGVKGELKVFSFKPTCPDKLEQIINRAFPD